MRCVIPLIISVLVVTTIADAQTRFRSPWSARLAAMIDGPGNRDVAIDVDGNIWRYTAGDRTWSWRPASYPKGIRRGMSMTSESGVFLTSNDDVVCMSIPEPIQRWRMSVPSIRDIDTQHQHVVLYVGDSVIQVAYDGQVKRRERIPDVVKIRYSPEGATWITATGKLFRNESGMVRIESIPVIDSIRSAYLDDTVAVVITATSCAVLDITEYRFGRLNYFFRLPKAGKVDDVCIVRLSPDEIITSIVVDSIRQPCIINTKHGFYKAELFPDSPLSSDHPLVFSSPSPSEIHIGFGDHAGILRCNLQAARRNYTISQRAQSGSMDRIRSYRRFDDASEVAVMECRPPYLPLVDYSQIVVVSRQSGRLRWWSIVENLPTLASYSIESPDLVVRRSANEHMVIDSIGTHTVVQPPGVDTMCVASNLALAVGEHLMSSTDGGSTWRDVENVPGTPLSVNYVYPLGFLVRVYHNTFGLRWYQYHQDRFEYALALSKTTSLATNRTASQMLFVADTDQKDQPRFAVIRRDADTQYVETLENFTTHVVRPQAHFDGRALIASAFDWGTPPSIKLRVFDSDTSTERYQTDNSWKSTPIVGLGIDKDSIYIVYQSTDVISKPRISPTTHLLDSGVLPPQSESQHCNVISADAGRYLLVSHDAEVVIVDVTGRVVSCPRIRQGELTYLAAADVLPAGLYYVKVVTSESCQTTVPLVVSR